MSAPAPGPFASTSATGLTDGLGRRTLVFDRQCGGIFEHLHLRPELVAFEDALRRRVSRVTPFDDERFAHVRNVAPDADAGGLVVVSEFVAGDRLSDLLEDAALYGRDESAAPGIDVAIGFLMQALSALSALHATAGITHGAVAPARLVVTATGQIVLTDYIYAQVLQRLVFTRLRLWNELGLAMPQAAGPPRFDVAADLGQAALSTLMLALGRPMRREDYPNRLRGLLMDVTEIAQIRASATFADDLRRLFERMLPLPGRRPFGSADEASEELTRITAPALGLDACRNALPVFVAEIAAAREAAPRDPGEAPADAIDVEAWVALAHEPPRLDVPAEEPPPVTLSPVEPVQVEAPYSASVAIEDLAPKPEPVVAAGVPPEPAALDSVAPEPVLLEPAAPEPEPVAHEPVPEAEVQQAVTPEPVRLEPARPDPATPAPAPPAPVVAEKPQPALAAAPEPIVAAPPMPEPAPVTAPPPAPEPEQEPATPPAPPASSRRRRGRGVRDKLRSLKLPPPVAPPPAPPPVRTPVPVVGFAPPAPAVSSPPPVGFAPPSPIIAAPPPPPRPLPVEPPSPYIQALRTESWQPSPATVPIAPPAARAPAPVTFAPVMAKAPIAIAPQAAAPPAVRIKSEPPQGYAPPRPEPRMEPLEDFDAAGPFAPRRTGDEGSRFPWKIAAAIVVVVGGLVGGRAFMLNRPAETGDRPARSAPAVPAPANAAPVAKNGTLVLETQPAGARVLLDGAAAGETPLTIADVPPGRHVLTFVTSSATVKRAVRVEAGKTLTLDVPVYSGWVAIFAPIVLHVSEGGRAIGTTEQGRLMLSPGRHELTLSNRALGYTTVQTIEIEPGLEQALNIDPRGAVSLNAVPWAEVFIDGQRAGETPIANLQVPLGSREFLFKHPEHGERRITTTVMGNAPTALSVDFTKFN